jgi:hypothetical protein
MSIRPSFHMKQLVSQWMNFHEIWYPNIFRKSAENVQVFLNLLNPAGFVMHRQFRIQQLYALPTLYLWVLYLSENKQRLVSLTA